VQVEDAGLERDVHLGQRAEDPTTGEGVDGRLPPILRGAVESIAERGLGDAPALAVADAPWALAPPDADPAGRAAQPTRAASPRPAPRAQCRPAGRRERARAPGTVRCPPAPLRRRCPRPPRPTSPPSTRAPPQIHLRAPTRRRGRPATASPPRPPAGARS